MNLIESQITLDGKAMSFLTGLTILGIVEQFGV